MEGDLSLTHGISRSAGIIPRTLYSLFAKLAEDKSEFSVRCSFIELYNEELRDLNALEFTEPHAAGQPMDNRNAHGAVGSNGNVGLKIYDDKTAGTGVVIQGLEETLIMSAEEGIKVLKRGSERRQIAATKCNEQSRRARLFGSRTHGDANNAAPQSLSLNLHRNGTHQGSVQDGRRRPSQGRQAQPRRSRWIGERRPQWSGAGQGTRGGHD
jgi:hypothetical protein